LWRFDNSSKQEDEEVGLIHPIPSMPPFQVDMSFNSGTMRLTIIRPAKPPNYTCNVTNTCGVTERASWLYHLFTSSGCEGVSTGPSIIRSLLPNDKPPENSIS
jgi:hypothetical protein